MIDLEPGNVHDPIAFDIGDDWFIEIDCTDASGAPLDLTGASLEWTLFNAADPVDAATPLQTLTLGQGVTLDGTPPTKAIVWLHHTETTQLIPGFYRDRFRVTTVAGVVSTQSVGRIEAVAV